MSIKSKIIKYFKKNKIFSPASGLTTLELSEIFYLSRQNMSTELNQMIKENLLKKTSSRPVRYYMTENQEVNNDSFSKLIGVKGSLKQVVEMAKASIIYPPNGLNTIISGPSGSGKSFLAEIMYNYAIETNTLDPMAPFVVFNCADYANNPQLLLSHLFGYTKGAFTGAQTDSQGIVTKANGGILFLDEVHRLPPEGQEMLFILIDKGYFYRLGDSNHPVQVTIRIIAATSISPKDALLTTFIRRFPTQITLPALSSRPLKEKYDLIKHYFQQEANHLGTSLLVRSNCIDALLTYELPGNIGELKNTIRQVCAKAFLNYIQSEKIDDLIHVYITHLPNSILFSYLHAENVEHNSFTTEEEIMFFHQGEQDFTNRTDLSNHLYDMVLHYHQNGYSTEEIYTLTKNDISNFINLLHKTNENVTLNPNFIKQIPNEWIKGLNNELINDFANTLLIFIEFIKNHSITNSIQNAQPSIYPKEKLKLFPSNLSYVDQIILYCMINHYSSLSSFQNKTHIIVICHGESTASSLVNVAKQLIEYQHIYSFNMPLDTPLKRIEEKLDSLIQRIGKEVLLIVDMGSLKTLKESLSKKYPIHIGIIDMATTMMIIEACRMAKYSNMSAPEIAQDIANKYHINTYETSTNTKVLLTSCLTGQGTSKRLLCYLEEFLKENNIDNVEVKNIDSLKNPISYIGKNNVVAVIGTINPHLLNIPFIGIERLLFSDGKEMINNLIFKQKGKMAEYEHDLRLENIDDVKAISIQFIKDNLDPVYRDTIIHCILDTLTDLEKIIHIQLSVNQVARFIIHYAFCLERLLHNEAMNECNDLDEIMKNHSDLYELLESVLSIHLPEMITKIPKEEMAYIVQIFI